MPMGLSTELQYALPHIPASDRHDLSMIESCKSDRWSHPFQPGQYPLLEPVGNNSPDPAAGESWSTSNGVVRYQGWDWK